MLSSELNPPRDSLTVPRLRLHFGNLMPLEQCCRCHALSAKDRTDSEIIGSKYDAWIPNLRLFNAFLNPTSTANITTAETQAGTIQTLCGAVQQECTGSNAQYTSIGDCIETLSAKPFGDWDEVWQDSVICRELHVILARVDPEVSFLLEPYSQQEGNIPSSERSNSRHLGSLPTRRTYRWREVRQRGLQ